MEHLAKIKAVAEEKGEEQREGGAEGTLRAGRFCLAFGANFAYVMLISVLIVYGGLPSWLGLLLIMPIPILAVVFNERIKGWLLR